MINLQIKVEHCLAKYPDTRNSDILLTRAVWWEYHNSSIFEHNGRKAVHLDDLMDLPREDHIKRLRAKLNEAGKYLPTDEKVIKQRRLLEKVWHQEMSPSNPSKG